MAINTANDLYISINDELRPWSDVSQDIIEYLRNKVETVTHSLVYRGSVSNLDALNAIVSPAIGDMYNVIEDNNNNYAWNGTEWDSLGPLASTIDPVAIENSENAIQSGFVYNALMNYAEYEDIQRIIDTVFGEQTILDITTSISQQFSDINQDISDIQLTLSNIPITGAGPNPLISEDMNNAITTGSDNGLYVEKSTETISGIQTIVSEHTTSISSLTERVVELESNTGTSTISSIVNITNDTETIAIDSDKVMYRLASGDVTFEFTPSSNPSDFAEKYMYIEASNDIRLSVQNAEWSMVQEEPTFYLAGHYMLIKIIWIAGKVIIETIDLNQIPDEINP